MSSVMLSLGKLKFTIGKNEFSRFTDEKEFLWTEMRTLSQKLPGYKFLGEGARTRTLNGVTFPVKSGQTALNIGEDIDAEASKGRPLYLFNSLGDSLGQWVILKRELENELLTADGYPRSVTYSITIAQVKAPDKQLGGPSGGGEVIV